jgi:uncharacterized protein YndB with AHSA1/START domain
MPTTRRSRTLPCTTDDIWRVIGDPQHLPRWWPRVERIESDDGTAFTQLLRTDKGRAVRADFRRAETEPGRRIAWEQQVTNTPFERLMQSARTEIVLGPAGEGTEVAIEVRQKLRGLARFGLFFFRGAARRQLDEALDGLERACA